MNSSLSILRDLGLAPVTSAFMAAMSWSIADRERNDLQVLPHSCVHAKEFPMKAQDNCWFLFYAMKKKKKQFVESFGTCVYFSAHKNRCIASAVVGATGTESVGAARRKPGASPPERWLFDRKCTAEVTDVSPRSQSAGRERLSSGV
ncbi:hypothetical protein RYX36_017302 [Vicia faba]